MSVRAFQPSIRSLRGTGPLPGLAAHGPARVATALRSQGQPLDATTRALMEPRFGHDFSHVRVHTDARAVASARAIDARAYTVGPDIVFGEGQYAAHTSEGRRLIAHELAHVLQQRGSSQGGSLTVNAPGDAFEIEADAAARSVVAGARVAIPPAPGCRTVQRQGPADDQQKAAREAPDAITEGLKTVAEQAADNNPKVKQVVIEPLKQRAKGQWGRLSGGEKAAVIGWGAGTLALAGGSMLSDPHGRRTLQGVNLAAPLTLVPYVPLSRFAYTLPSGDSPETRLFRFETGFTGDELISLHTERRGLPKMTLRVNVRWGFDPATDRLSVLGGDATIGVVPGLSISGGAYRDVLRQPQTFIGEGGQLTQIGKSVPGPATPEPIPDVRVMVTVDLLKFKPADLKRQLTGLVR